MHIAFVISDLYRLGAQYVTSLISKGLSDRGHQVDLLLSAYHREIEEKRPDLRAFPVAEEVRVFYLSNTRASRNIVGIAKYLKQQTPDVVIPMSTNYVVPVGLAARMYGLNVKIVPVEHNSGLSFKESRVADFDKRNGKLGLSLRNWVAGAVVGHFLRSCDHVIAVSSGVKEALQDVYKVSKTNISVIYNPVVDDNFRAKRLALPSHDWLSMKTTPVIVAAGSLVPMKGFDVLLNAMAQVVRQRPARLVVFGEGPWRDELISLAESLGIREQVSFPGYIANLPADLSRADCFVVSSFAESFSIVLVEALASGVPVVATNCPSGPSEILLNGKYGTLVQYGDSEMLARGILDTLDDKGKEAPAESWAPYQLERVSKNYEELLSSLLK